MPGHSRQIKMSNTSVSIVFSKWSIFLPVVSKLHQVLPEWTWCRSLAQTNYVSIRLVILSSKSRYHSYKWNTIKTETKQKKKYSCLHISSNVTLFSSVPPWFRAVWALVSGRSRTCNRCQLWATKPHGSHRSFSRTRSFLDRNRIWVSR